MAADTIDSKLQNLENNLKILIQSREADKEAKLQLQQQNEQLQIEIETLKGQLTDFQNQYKIAKIVSSTTVEKEESTELKHKLNEYIKEIDRCIAHLS
ncbi:hypothetical protein [Roseivirga misakiensis]|uniref:Uncharacterized protein n=1 Tax=Roseivirga misakiensis TaxID=1563681 RepID=A0A1E5T4W2_9BACT|nr:hypothetical protein [Roseivirga misakiensis]OEK06414.1 hypothetical protein BFP71_01685 [Roseivirga misakiensis]